MTRGPAAKSVPIHCGTHESGLNIIMIHHHSFCDGRHATYKAEPPMSDMLSPPPPLPLTWIPSQTHELSKG